MSYVLHVFICARGLSENWRYCSVTSSDSVTPRRFSTTPTTRCCLGCGPTAPPTCRGTGMHPLPSYSTTPRQPPYKQQHSHTCKRCSKKRWLCADCFVHVSINVSLMLIWDHCVADSSLLLLYIFVCLAHTCSTAPSPIVHSLGSSSFSFPSAVLHAAHPPSTIFHLFSGRQRVHAGLSLKLRDVLSDLYH